MSALNEVIILFNGFSKIDLHDSKIFLTNCTCTLIKGANNFNIIIDTMTPWDGPKILQALKQHSLNPEDISVVISTHGHSDHTGNNNLFLNAKWHIVGQSIMNKNHYLIHEPWTPFELTPEIRVVKSEGHTLSCVTVIVENSQFGVTAICGDLFEKQEDIADPLVWQEVGSEDPKAQFENRSKIADMVDYIVPGHGEAFPVTTEIRDKLRQQFKNN